MRASEWQFLCAVHESPKSCCAIDYCCHTLDWATNIVTSQKIFPSRLSLGAGDAMDERGAGVKHLTNIFRRLHRIFAHAWFQHRGVFWQVEGQTGLYVLFKTVCDTYDLLPAENYKLPPEAEGLEPAEEVRSAAPSIMKSVPALGNVFLTDDDSNRKNTRRHIRQSPSVGSAVTTVLEADEEEGDVTQKFEELQIAEEDGDNEIPVIVESYEEDSSHENEDMKLELETERETVDEGEQSLDAPAGSTSSTSSWDSMSSELDEKPGPEPENPENPDSEKQEYEPVTDTSVEAQRGALLDVATGKEEDPAIEKLSVEKVSRRDDDKETESLDEKEHEEKADEKK